MVHSCLLFLFCMHSIEQQYSYFPRLLGWPLKVFMLIGLTENEGWLKTRGMKTQYAKTGYWGTNKSFKFRTGNLRISYLVFKMSDTKRKD